MKYAENGNRRMVGQTASFLAKNGSLGTGTTENLLNKLD